MIDKIKGLKKYTDCSMPANEKERMHKAEVSAYNQAIDDVVKLFAIHNVVGRSEQLKCMMKRTDGNCDCGIGNCIEGGW